VTSPWSERRRIERFAELVDPSDAGPRHHRRSHREEELAECAALTHELSDVRLAPDPDPEFRGSLRSFLMATAEREGIGATAEPARSAAQAALAGKTQVVKQVRAVSTTTGPTRLALLAGATVGAIALSGVSLASTDSLPGDTLYQVKLSAERAQLAMAGSDLGRGQLHLEFARARLAEADRVSSARLAATLAETDVETAEGVKLLTGAAVAGDLSALDLITVFVERQAKDLARLQQKLTSAQDRASTALSFVLLDRVDRRVRELTALLPSACPRPHYDDLGIKPESC